MTRPDPQPDAAVRAASLGGRTVRAAAAMFIGRGAGQFVQLAGTAILARFLVPDQVGIVVMVAVVTSLLTIVLDLGLSTATVRARELPTREAQAVFWTNTTLGFLLAAAFALAAPLLAAAYGDPRIAPLAVAMSCILPLRGLAAQPAALLRRAMAFRAVAGCQLATTLVGVPTAIALAGAGAGSWAIVGMHLASATAHFVGHAWAARRHCAWRPGSPVEALRTVRDGGLRPHLAFGGGFLGSTLVTHGGQSAQAMLVGGGLGAAAAGLWQRGLVLANLPCDQIRQPAAEVAVPALSRVAVSPARLADAMRRMATLMFAGVFVVVALTVVLAEPIIRVLLGPNWLEVAPLLRWFSVAAGAAALLNAGSWLFVATGRSDRLLRWSALSSATSLGLVAMALPRGVETAAAAHAVGLAAVALPMLGVAARSVGLDDRTLVRAIAPALVGAITAGLAAHFVAATLAGAAPGTPAFLVLLAAAPVGLGLHFGLLVGAFGQGPLLREAGTLLLGRPAKCDSPDAPAVAARLDPPDTPVRKAA